MACVGQAYQSRKGFPKSDPKPLSPATPEAYAEAQVVFGIAIFSIPVGILVEAVKGSRNYHVQFGVWRQFKYSMSPATSYEAVGECGPS